MGKDAKKGQEEGVLFVSHNLIADPALASFVIAHDWHPSPCKSKTTVDSIPQTAIVNSSDLRAVHFMEQPLLTWSDH